MYNRNIDSSIRNEREFSPKEPSNAKQAIAFKLNWRVTNDDRPTAEKKAERRQALEAVCGVQKTYVESEYISTYPTDGFSRCHVAPILGSVVLHVKIKNLGRRGAEAEENIERPIRVNE